MSTIDKSKPVYRVVGTLPPPDGRRMTVFCNATDESSADAAGRAEGLHTVERVKLITPEQIAEWESWGSKL